MNAAAASTKNDQNAAPLPPVLKMPVAARGITAISPALFGERVSKPANGDYYTIALPAAPAERVAQYHNVSYRMLHALWQDSGDVRADMLRVLVTALNAHVPEYAAAAAHAKADGQAEKMPRVIIRLDNGQIYNIGRPRAPHGVLAAAFEKESALTISRIAPSENGVTLHNAAATAPERVDLQAEKLYDTREEGLIFDRMEDILSTLLAAASKSRQHILREVDPSVREAMPVGPLRVQSPFNCYRP